MSNKVVIPKTQILELRQKNKRTSNQRPDKQFGDYNVTLDEALIVNEGDEVSIHSVFLDTETANDGLILLTPDTDGGTTTTISAEFGYYLTNTPTANETPFNTGAQIVSKNYSQLNAAASQNSAVNSDGELYVACLKNIPNAPANVRICTGFSLAVAGGEANPQYPLEIDKNQSCILEIAFSYKASGDNNVLTDTISIHIGILRQIGLNKVFNAGLIQIDENIILDVNRINPKCITGSGFPIHIDNTANINGSGQPIIIQSVSINTSENQKFIGFPVSAQNFILSAADTPDAMLNVYRDTISVTLDSGTYTASQICDILGQKFTDIELNGVIGSDTYDLTNNPLLTTSANLIRKARERKGAGADDTIEFVRTDGQASFNLTTRLDASPATTLAAGTPNYLIGTSQFGLLYNDTANKVELHLLHESLLDLNSTSAGQPQIRGYVNQAVTPPRQGGVATNPAPKKYFANKYGGVFFTKLSPPSLWFDQLKFNRNLEVGITMSTKDAGLVVNGVSLSAPIFSDTNPIPNALVEGRNITGDGKGLDAIVVKKANQTADGFDKAYDIANPFIAFPNFISTNSDDNIGIHSEGIINTGQYVAQESEGYYQIELNLGINQDIHGKDNTNNKIHGIVSRYYSQGSYTSSYGEGSIPYIHKGAPLTINDINVRILNPDNSLARDIDDNNTIFLQIVKNN